MIIPPFVFSNGCDDSLPLAVCFLNVSCFWNLSPVLAIGHFLRAAVSNTIPGLEVPRANIWGKMEKVTDFIFLGSKITVDSEYSFDHFKDKFKDTCSFSSVQFSRSIMSDSLQPHESQHIRPPCPSPTPGVHTQTHVHQVSDAIQPSHPLASPSPPAPNPSQHQSLFQ